MAYKIVWSDGYNREHVADRVVAENISNKREAEKMVEGLLNNGHDSDWYKVMEQNEKVWRGMEEFV